MKIAITGSKGFLGQYVIKVLEGNTITEFNHEKNSLFSVNSLKDFVTDQDAVIHIAGLNRATDYNLLKTNVLGTAGILEAIKQFNPKIKFIFTSSAQVLDIKNLYGVSKLEAEEIIEWYTKLTEISGIILRISNIYGPKGKPFYNSVIATFAHLIQENKPLQINGDGNQKRDYIFVSDVAEAIKSALYCNNKFEIFDICSNTQTSLNDIIEISSRLLGKNIAVSYNKEVPSLGDAHIQSFKRAQEILQWEPKISLEEGLRQTFI
ncbi:MAG TPA: NAD(P)-dependent oxidoreductase [Patescibacteria group bacterium]